MPGALKVKKWGNPPKSAKSLGGSRIPNADPRTIGPTPQETKKKPE